MSDDSDTELSVGVPSPVGDVRHHFPLQRDVRDSRSSTAPAVDNSGSYDAPDEDDLRSVSTQSYRDQERLRNDSGNSGSASSAANRNPTCALCKNHQTVSILKSHKRHCPWRNCPCELCYNTNKKRKINAEQVALRRAQKQDEELIKKGVIQPLTSGESTLAAPVSVPVHQSPTSIKPPPLEASGKVPKKVECPASVKAKHSSSAAASLRSSVASAVNGCPKAGPMMFSQQLSLGSMLMSQNVSLLRESVCDSRLGVDILNFLLHIVQNVKGEVDNVSHQLNTIYREIQMKIDSNNLASVAMAAGASSSFIFGEPPPAGVHHPTAHHALAGHYPIPSSVPPHVRASVINTPYTTIHQPIYSS